MIMLDELDEDDVVEEELVNGMLDEHDPRVVVKHSVSCLFPSLCLSREGQYV